MELAKNVKNGHNTYTGQVEWMDMEATSVDIEMLSRWWVATVFDTDCLQPLKQTHGCSLWSSGKLLAPLVPLIPRHQWVRHHCRCCDRLPVAPSRAPLARCRWLRPRHLAREAPRLCLVETVLQSPEGVLLLREAHAAPHRSNR